MSTSSTKAKQNSRKRVSRKKSAALSTCPTGAAGWCSYPFSIAQLEKRLKAKQAAAEQNSEQSETKKR